MTLEGKLRVDVLVSIVEEFGERSFFAQDKVGSCSTILELRVEVASRLHVVSTVEDFAEALQELSLTSVRSSVNEHTVGLVFGAHDQVLADVSNERSVLGFFDSFDYLLDSFGTVPDLFDEGSKVRSSVGKLLLVAKVLVEILLHLLELILPHDSVEE